MDNAENAPNHNPVALTRKIRQVRLHSAQPNLGELGNSCKNCWALQLRLLLLNLAIPAFPWLGTLHDMRALLPS
jgi:hypothetical protein